MSKLDLYTMIHKAQRGHLFALGSKIGQTDFSRKEEVADVKKEILAMITHLHEHSHNEETFVHPLFSEVSNQSMVIDEEHEELEKELNNLEKMVREEKWEKIYPQYNRFLATYLLHQDGEERAQEEILWKYFDNERLVGVLAAFKASRSQEKDMEDMHFIIPHLSLPELSDLFMNIRSHAPQTVFMSVCQIAKEDLSHDRWTRLNELLN